MVEKRRVNLFAQHGVPPWVVVQWHSNHRVGYRAGWASGSCSASPIMVRETPLHMCNPFALMLYTGMGLLVDWRLVGSMWRVNIPGCVLLRAQSRFLYCTCCVSYMLMASAQVCSISPSGQEALVVSENGPFLWRASRQDSSDGQFSRVGTEEGVGAKYSPMPVPQCIICFLLSGGRLRSEGGCKINSMLCVSCSCCPIDIHDMQLWWQRSVILLCLSASKEFEMRVYPLDHCDHLMCRSVEFTVLLSACTDTAMNQTRISSIVELVTSEEAPTRTRASNAHSHACRDAMQPVCAAVASDEVWILSPHSSLSCLTLNATQPTGTVLLLWLRCTRSVPNVLSAAKNELPTVGASVSFSADIPGPSVPSSVSCVFYGALVGVYSILVMWVQLVLMSPLSSQSGRHSEEVVVCFPSGEVIGVDVSCYRLRTLHAGVDSAWAMQVCKSYYSFACNCKLSLNITDLQVGVSEPFSLWFWAAVGCLSRAEVASVRDAA